MTNFTVQFPDGTRTDFSHPITGSDIRHKLEDKNKTLLAIRVNNELMSLARKIDVSSKIEPVYNDTNEGSNVYRRTLCFVLAAATKIVYPKLRLLIGHSFGYGYYYSFEFEGQNTSIDIQAIKNKMKELIALNLPVETGYISYEDATKLFSTSNQPDTYKLLKHISKPKILINKLDCYVDIYFQPLLDKIGVLTIFDLITYKEGFILRFPPTKHPDRLCEFEDIPELFEIYTESKAWGKLIKVSSAGELNELIEQRRIRDFVDITETLQNKKIAEIADKIARKKTTKIVLIAGPSSSGKTTTSKKLSMQLKVLGYDPVVISLDNYYRGPENTPLDDEGKPDFECLEALDIPFLNEILLSLFNGDAVDLPSYDFKTGKRSFSGKLLKLHERSIIIMEGIHGLNDQLTPSIPKELTYKIYLSALTQLNLDDHNRIPTSDNRLLRRIVRDAQFRGKGAAGTISMWKSVQRGERLHIFPFQTKSDSMFNTALDYELPVLKIFAEPLLRAVKPTEKEYAEASRLLMFLNNFSPIPPSYVPGQSILREFIGDSEFKY